jgi:hypothetical protein
MYEYNAQLKARLQHPFPRDGSFRVEDQQLLNLSWKLSAFSVLNREGPVVFRNGVYSMNIYGLADIVSITRAAVANWCWQLISIFSSP